MTLKVIQGHLWDSIPLHLFKTTKVKMGAVDSKIKCETNYDNTATATSEIYFT